MVTITESKMRITPPHFTLREIFLAITLISLGLALGVWVIRQKPEGIKIVLGFGGLFLSAAFIGAGLFTPFHRPKTGAVTGLMTVVLVFIVGALYAFLKSLHS